MRLSCILSAIGFLAASASATILQNGVPRITNFPDTVIDLSAQSWKTYPPSAEELSYKGRWDSKFISWWSAPGLKFGFTGDRVAITFGPFTTNATLIAFRIDGQDWQFTNVTTNATHLLVNPDLNVNPGINVTTPINPSTFELRVTNWAFGVQIDSVHVAPDANLIKIPSFDRTIEVIGDSLSAGQYATYEAIASWSYGLAAGLGNTEYSISAYPGICLFDKECNGNLHGQTYQWFRTSDTSFRSTQVWGDDPPLYDFNAHAAADIVLINLGTNDSGNNVTSAEFTQQYTELIEGVHGVWPDAQIILISLWGGFSAVGNTYQQNGDFIPEIVSIADFFNSAAYLSNQVSWNDTTNTTSPVAQTQPFVHYFNTTGILQHNDIGPLFHPTDVGHIKLASNLIQYIKLMFGWTLYSTGPEVQHQTLYWNDQPDY